MPSRSPPRRNRRLHGQRAGRPLSPTLRSHLQHLDAISIAADVTRAQHDRQTLDLAKLFPSTPTVWLEIGFGAGEHLVHHGSLHRHIGLIGCEVFLRGIASAIGRARAARLANVRIHPGDIRDLLDVLPARSIARTFLMFPDPWPKRRHHKRRFVNDEYLDPLARVMAPGAVLRLATDSTDYVRQALTTIRIHGAFQWTARRQEDWRERWLDSITTRYEEKARCQNRRCTYLTFRRQG